MGQRRAVLLWHGVPAAARRAASWHRRVSAHRASRRSHPLGSSAGKNRAGQEGFALIEVIVAAVVLIILLTGVGIQLTSEYATIGSVRNEQAGEAVLTKALAEVRAMPFTLVAKGLSTSDTTATTTSTYISISGSTWTLKGTAAPSLSGHGATEVINKYTPTGSNPPAPFYPHVSHTTVNSITFTVRAFPTKYKSGATTLTDVYRVTVIVTWKAPGKGTPLTLLGQTVVYSKTSTCATLSSTHVPYSAPCIPDFTSTGFAGLGSIGLDRVRQDVTPIQGMSFTSFSLELGGASETSALTQISTVDGTAQATGATVTPGSSSDKVLIVATSATNDLAQGSGTSQSSSATSTLTALDKTATTGPNTLTATPSTGDTVASLSTIAAKTATACKNLSTTIQVTTLPCARGTSTQEHAATLKADLYAGAENLGTLPLASVGATTTNANKVFSARYGGGKIVTCPSTATSGCINSSVKRGLGAVRLAGIPHQFITDSAGPPGFSVTNYLLQLTGYSASATVWAKSSGRVAPTGTVAGTLTYYTFNANKYQQVILTGARKSITIPTVTATDTKIAGGAVTLTMSVTVHLGSMSTKAPTSTTCVSACTYKSSISSPVTGTITYDITQTTSLLGHKVTLANFAEQVDLGQTVATASYQKAT